MSNPIYQRALSVSILIVLLVLVLLIKAGGAEKKQLKQSKQENAVMINKSDADWRCDLEPEQYRITRQKGTEAPFSGKYNDFKGDGMFVCVCCGTELFSSSTKYNSGSGWPSFWEPIAKENIAEESDYSFGMIRTEVQCSNCGAHLGHVFEDGPQPTGLRYCINSASLDFKEKKDSSEKK